MISIERSREVRIKRANTDWWINEKAVVGLNGLTYIAYCTDMGEIHVKEFDAKCSRTPSRDVTLCRLNCNYADEHNAPSLCVMEDGRIAVAYTGHGSTHTLTFRVTERPCDIMSFGRPLVLHYQNSVTYAQLFENTARGELWLFTRVNGVTWEFRTSADGGASFGEPVVFLASDAGGLFYFDVRKQLVKSPAGPVERWFFALYGHPRISGDHTVRSGFFDADGDLTNMNGEPLGVNLFGQGKTAMIDLETLDQVYVSPEGTTVRLLDVSPTVPCRVALCPFTLDRPESAVYVVATWKDGAWKLSEPLCTVGEFLSKPPQLDGSQTYVGGMAFYYGVGEDGLSRHKSMPYTSTNRVFIARFDGEARVLESYQSFDNGVSYRLEQVIRRIPAAGDFSADTKIWRPIVPIHAQDNLPVYWHEGHYSAHTGGWHCDAVMYVEYDD